MGKMGPGKGSIALTGRRKEALQNEDRRSDQEEGAKSEQDEAQRGGDLGVKHGAVELGPNALGEARSAHDD